MVVVRAFKHHGACFKSALLAGAAQVAGAEGFGDHRGLQNTKVKQVAAEHQEAGLLQQRLVKRANHLTVAGFAALQVLAHRAARHAGAVVVQAPGLLQLPHQRGHPASAEKALAQKLACGLHVQQQGQVIGVLGPVLGLQHHACVARHGHDVYLRIARPPGHAHHRQRVEKALARQDARRAQVLIGHLDDATPGFVGHLASFSVGCWNGSAAGQ